MAERVQSGALETQLFYEVFNASPIGIVLENMEGEPLFVNAFFCSMLGFSEEELRSKHCVDFSPAEDAEKDWALFQQLKAGLIDRYQIEKRYYRRDGSLVWGRLSISLLNQTPRLVIATVEDITEKRLAEEVRARHAAIVESSEDAIISQNLDGIIQSWNAGAQNIFGYTEVEAVGQPFSIIVPADLWQEEQQILERLKAGERIEHYETIRITKRGKKIRVSLSISVIRDASGRVTGFSKIDRDITERKLTEDTLADVSRKLVDIQEEERRRIARELHDDISQRLAMLSVELEQLKMNPPNSADELKGQLTGIGQSVHGVSKGVQSISHQLHPPQLEYLGLVAAMKSFCQEYAARRKVEIDFTSDDIPQPVSHEISLCLFRILQEALHNAARHSGVRNFRVSLNDSSNQLHLAVSDAGSGFEVESAMNKGGLGLTSMRERVRLVHGAILIESKPMAGTTIHVCVPLGAERGSHH
jgi:PAS domain S-box-containing protein